MSKPIEDADNGIAFLSGIFHACGQLTKNSEGLRADIVTDLKEIFDYVNSIVKKLYGDTLSLEISDDYIINKTTYYRIMFPVSISERVLVDCGILDLIDGLTIKRGIDKNIIQDEECKKAVITGAYIGCSTSSIRLSELGSQTATTGYHLEFASHTYQFLEDLQSLLSEFSITSKLVERKKIFVLYLKDSEAIKDLLALVGAGQSVLDLSDEMAKRGLRNTVNRQVNCINANINKTIEASMKQIEAINLINHKIGLDALPDDLQEVAVLRLANQQESMDELLKLSTIKLTKSGLNHRFRRLIKIAEILKQG
jgi:hypothetical protein